MTDEPYVMPSWEDATPVDTVVTTGTTWAAEFACVCGARLVTGAGAPECPSCRRTMVPVGTKGTAR